MASMFILLKITVKPMTIWPFGHNNNTNNKEEYYCYLFINVYLNAMVLISFTGSEIIYNLKFCINFKTRHD